MRSTPDDDYIGGMDQPVSLGADQIVVAPKAPQLPAWVPWAIGLAGLYILMKSEWKRQR